MLFQEATEALAGLIVVESGLWTYDAVVSIEIGSLGRTLSTLLGEHIIALEFRARHANPGNIIKVLRMVAFDTFEATPECICRAFTLALLIDDLPS